MYLNVLCTVASGSFTTCLAYVCFVIFIAPLRQLSAELVHLFLLRYLSLSFLMHENTGFVSCFLILARGQAIMFSQRLSLTSTSKTACGKPADGSVPATKSGWTLEAE